MQSQQLVIKGTFLLGVHGITFALDTSLNYEYSLNTFFSFEYYTPLNSSESLILMISESQF